MIKCKRCSCEYIDFGDVHFDMCTCGHDWSDHEYEDRRL